MDNLQRVLIGNGKYYMKKITPDMDFSSVVGTGLSNIDTSNSIEIILNANVLNEKLNITKNSETGEILTHSYILNGKEGHFEKDNISLSGEEFRECIINETCKFININEIESIYKLFCKDIKHYFDQYGSAYTIFKNSNSYLLNSEKILKPDDMNSALKGEKDISTGVYFPHIDGELCIENLSSIFKTMCFQNTFNNRVTNNDLLLPYHGFIEGDAIYLPHGFNISICMDLETNENVSLTDMINEENELVSEDLLYATCYESNRTEVYRHIRLPLLIRIVDNTHEYIEKIKKEKEIQKSTKVNNNLNNNVFEIKTKTVKETISIKDFTKKITTKAPLKRNVPKNFEWKLQYESKLNYTCIAISDRADISCIGVNQKRIYLSNDYGDTWNPSQQNLNQMWNTIAISESGDLIIAGTLYSYLYKSKDHGITWNKCCYVHQWNSLAISDNGQYITGGIVNGFLKISNDFGETWESTAKEFNKKNWISVKISKTGKQQTALSVDDGIYISNDYGINWKKTFDMKIQWKAIAMSEDAKYQIACAKRNYVYESEDYGITWIPITKLNIKDWVGVAISYNGLYRTIVAKFDKIYVSINAGKDYEECPDSIASKQWVDIDMTKSGNIQFAVAKNEGVYKLEIIPKV